MFLRTINSIDKISQLEVGRLHSLAFLQLLLSEFSILLTGFSVLERTVGVDIKIITVRVVQIVIFNALKHKPVSLASQGQASCYLAWWIFELVEGKTGVKLRISVQSLISHQWSFTAVLLTV